MTMTKIGKAVINMILTAICIVLMLSTIHKAFLVLGVQPKNQQEYSQSWYASELQPVVFTELRRLGYAQYDTNTDTYVIVNAPDNGLLPLKISLNGEEQHVLLVFDEENNDMYTIFKSQDSATADKDWTLDDWLNDEDTMQYLQLLKIRS